jgi:hypothetical protein
MSNEQAPEGKEVIGVLIHPEAGVLATFQETDGEIEFEDGQVRKIAAVMDFVDGDPNQPACYVTFDASDYVTDPYQVIYTLQEEDGSPGLALGQPQPTRGAAIEEAHAVYSRHFAELAGRDADVD